jgi:carboxypeptidase C (cathepsin A)
MLGDLESNFAEDIPKIIAANVRVLIYNGVKDLICNFIGTERWLDAMEWDGQVRAKIYSQDHIFFYYSGVIYLYA